MATSTVDRDPQHSDGQPVNQGKCGVDIFYGGCMLTIDTTSSGYLRDGDTPRIDEIFAGVAFEGVDNSGGSAGDKSLRYWNEGGFEFIIGATADQSYVGKAAYLLTNQEVTLTAGAFGIYVGIITHVISATKVRVRIDTRAAQTLAGVIPFGSTGGVRPYFGTGAFITTGTTAAVTAGGLTTIVGGYVTPVIDAGAAVANGQLGFTEAGSTGLPEISGGNVTVNRIAGTDSGLKFNYVLWGN